ncbi:MAG: LysR family transcriptional regulator [Verrucomicrobia bacterium]|nr:LysR family transcriptional regulator [Verrucomicrobiota bacterium]
MNIHHLELFYFVARHGGISEAVRNIPYGIQQPAVSAQVLQLEADLGVTLFQRRPFQLTPAGAELYEFIQPFFANVDAVAEKLRGGATQLVRIAASMVVLKDHLPALLGNLRRKFPKLKFTLHDGIQPQIEDWLNRREIDIAITVIEGRPAAGIRAEKLIELPLCLLAGPESTLKSAEELWRRDRIAEPLISLPSNEAVGRNFQRGLARLKVDWPIGIEVNSLDLVPTYVANGFGLGVFVQVPGSPVPRGVRVLPLSGFDPVVIGVLWHGKGSSVALALLAELRARAAEVAARKRA